MTEFRRRRRRWRWGRILAVVAVLAAVSLVCGNMAWSSYTADLPSVYELGTASLSQVTRIYASDGTTLIEERYRENRTVVPLSGISQALQDATIAVEDRDFYAHKGFDLPRIAGAAMYDLTHGSATQGASTITMQVVKNTVLPPDSGSAPSIDWKVKELILASEVEDRYSKEQILALYLNSIYYGRSAYGIEAAAETYFQRPATELTLAEAAFLAGLPQSPARYDTSTPAGLAAARARQRVVLDAMVATGKLSPSTADVAYSIDIGGEIGSAPPRPQAGRVSAAPHFVDYVLDQLRQRLGDEVVARGGLTVVTTLSLRAQQLAQTAVQDEVAAVARTTRSIPSDADGQPASGPNNGAALVIAPQTGAILAMVGSRDYNDPAINGARNMTVDEPRQVGSSFKPYTYATALGSGYTPSTMLEDGNPNFPSDPTYHPHDFDNKQMGNITLSTSLQQSRNISSVHLFEALGAARVFATAQNLGIPPQDLKSTGLSATLGTNELRMIDHVAAFGAFGNGGRRVRPWSIVKVTDSHGKVLDDGSGHQLTPAISPTVAATLTGILKGAVPSTYQLAIPVAGKSGTTEHYTDAWFIGYTTDLVVGAWMGRSDSRSARLHMNGVYGEISAGYVMRDFFKAWYGSAKPAEFVSPEPSSCGRGVVELPLAPPPAAGSIPAAPFQYPSPVPTPSRASLPTPSPRSTPQSRSTPSPRACPTPPGRGVIETPPALAPAVPPASVLPVYSPTPSSATTPGATPTP
ncbi:MAG TPA: transglycosylase domain-containing protein [Candidatus Dormibacteraeota bacterium]|nr:transglycosylase domain-containing protein [Candidatus Dormibacteraeota bacterium]